MIRESDSKNYRRGFEEFSSWNNASSSMWKYGNKNSMSNYKRNQYAENDKILHSKNYYVSLLIYDFFIEFSRPKNGSFVFFVDHQKEAGYSFLSNNLARRNIYVNFDFSDLRKFPLQSDEFIELNSVFVLITEPISYRDSKSTDSSAFMYASIISVLLFVFLMNFWTLYRLWLHVLCINQFEYVKGTLLTAPKWSVIHTQLYGKWMSVNENRYSRGKIASLLCLLLEIDRCRRFGWLIIRKFRSQMRHIAVH